MLDKEYIVILHGLYTDCSLICVKPCKGKKRLSAVAGSLFVLVNSEYLHGIYLLQTIQSLN